MLIETTDTLDEAMPKRNLTVKIAGLSLFKLVSDPSSTPPQWKIFFPKAADHPFKMIIETFTLNTNDSITNEFSLLPGTVIDFTPDGEERAGYDDGKIYGDAISIDELHKTVSDTPLLFSTNHNDYAGILNLNGATLMSEVSNEPPDTYEVWITVDDDSDGPSKELVEERKVKSSGLSAGFLVDSKDKTKIKIRKTSNFSIELPYKDDKNNDLSHTVTFSNDCDCEIDPIPGRNPTDFRFYYKIIDQSKLNVTFETIFKYLAGFQKAGSGCNPGGGGTIEIPPGIGNYIKEN